jgi:hypothetical protein
MAVNPERVNQIMADFQEKVSGIVRNTGLEHHSNTSNLAHIDSLKNQYLQTVMNAFILPATTEGELLSEMDATIGEITRLARGQAKAEATQIAAIGAAVNKGTPADSSIWNGIISDAAHRIDKITKMYADQINNMPKSLRARIDDDFAGVLDSINSAFNADPSPGNANIVTLQVKNSLATVEKNLADASRAVLKASIEHIAQKKMTELQEKEMVLMSVERGMTKGQIEATRTLVKDIRALILDFGKSNFLIYDKVIRSQKTDVIDHKLAVLETLRVNASGVSQSLSGYYGNTSRRRVTGSASIGGVGTTLGHNTSSVGGHKQNFRKGVPPGFAGFSGKMTEEDIANKHPPGTSKAHIQVMKKHMDAGMTFEAAHNKASAEGFTPNLGGGGGQPFR